MLEAVPYVRRLTAEADGQAFVEAANRVDQESVELQPPPERVPQLAIGSPLRQTCLPQSTGPTAIRLPGKGEVSGQESKHAQRDVLRLKDSERPTNQLGVVRLPAVVENAGIDAQTNAVPIAVSIRKPLSQDYCIPEQGASHANSGGEHELFKKQQPSQAKTFKAAHQNQLRQTRQLVAALKG